MMTKEELRKEAEEYRIHFENELYLFDNTDIFPNDIEKAYLAGIESREKQLQEKDNKIEKMKCCGNCSHFKTLTDVLYPIDSCELKYPNRCKNKDHWELAE